LRRLRPKELLVERAALLEIRHVHMDMNLRHRVLLLARALRPAAVVSWNEIDRAPSGIELDAAAVDEHLAQARAGALRAALGARQGQLEPFGRLAHRRAA